AKVLPAPDGPKIAARNGVWTCGVTQRVANGCTIWPAFRRSVPSAESPRKIGSARLGAAGGGGAIETGGAADCAAARGASERGALSLVPTSPSRRTFEFTLGSDNQSSSTRARKNWPSGA